MDAGNLICIDDDFVFERGSRSKDGVSLPAMDGSRQTIGFNTQENRRIFNFEDSEKPALILETSQDRAELEGTPAIRRSARPSNSRN